ncbi:hypothetical protein JCM10213v2_008130 [Rhodosporidiobolus nylandii]
MSSESDFTGLPPPPTPAHAEAALAVSPTSSSGSRRSSRSPSAAAEEGFPQQWEFENQVEDYLDSLSQNKRGKALITTIMYHQILSVLHAPSDTSQHTAQFRHWAKKTFRLENGGRMLKDRLPVCTKEELYFVITDSHRRVNHGGRDKTNADVKKRWSYALKELVGRYVAICPTCIARKKEANIDNSQPRKPRKAKSAADVQPKPRPSPLNLTPNGQSTSGMPNPRSHPVLSADVGSWSGSEGEGADDMDDELSLPTPPAEFSAEGYSPEGSISPTYPASFIQPTVVHAPLPAYPQTAALPTLNLPLSTSLIGSTEQLSPNLRASPPPSVSAELGTYLDAGDLFVAHTTPHPGFPSSTAPAGAYGPYPFRQDTLEQLEAFDQAWRGDSGGEDLEREKSQDAIRQEVLWDLINQAEDGAASHTSSSYSNEQPGEASVPLSDTDSETSSGEKAQKAAEALHSLVNGARPLLPESQGQSASVSRRTRTASERDEEEGEVSGRWSKRRTMSPAV